MTTEITWTISTLDRDVATGFVKTAHWQATAVDGEHTASIYSTASWADGTVNIAYDALTPETVLGWVWEQVSKTETEEKMQTVHINGVSPEGLPWE